MLKRFLTQSLIILLLTAAAGGIDYQVVHLTAPQQKNSQDLKESILWISPEDKIMRSPNTVYLDARTQDEFNQSTIPNAIHLSLDNWQDGFDQLMTVYEPEQNLLVYCGGYGCQASHKVAKRLKEAIQLKTIYVLQGGFPAYQDHQKGGRR